MRTVFVALLLAAFAIGLGNNTATAQDNSKRDKGQVTVQGCVSRSGGDYILMKPNAGVTYELQATGKIKLRDYMGQRVEVTGEESPTLSSSSDAMNKTGSASPVTITVRSISTVNKECPAR